MNKKIAQRIAFAFLLVALLGGFYLWFRKAEKDLGDVIGGSANTKDLIAAVKFEENGSQVVLIKPDGTLVPSPGYVEGTTEREPVWRPDGNRLFFAADRENGAFNIYRWNPSRNDVEQRTSGSRTKGNLSFGPPGTTSETGIMTAGGVVIEFNPRDGSTRQLLPPNANQRVATSEGEGAVSQFDALYQNLGSSFKSAKFGKDRNFVIAVMRRDGGEVLILQDMRPREIQGQKQIAPPIPIIAGERVDFDVAASGVVAVAVTDFQFVDRTNIPSEFIKNGVATPPYRHSLLFFDPEKPTEPATPVAISSTAENAAVRPRVSPDGLRVLAILGDIGETGQLTPKALLSVPLKRAGVQEAVPIAQGGILEAEWHPSGSKVVFTRRDGGQRMVYTVPADGGQPTPLTSGKGDFSHPIFSPQK